MLVGTGTLQARFTMAMIGCPECGKLISESATTCPNCGFALSPAIVAAQNAEKQKTDQFALVSLVGFFLLFMLVVCSGIFSSRPSSSPSLSSPPPPPIGSTPPTPSPRTDYLTDEARIRELGKKYYPSRDEIRESLILDARQSVREGTMSKEEYRRWTGETFPE